MQQFQKKKKIRGKLYSRTALVILSIIMLVLIKAVFNIYTKEIESRKAKEQTEAKLAELKDRQGKIRSETDSLKTNLGLEEEIRSKFSVAKPGEEVIVIVPKEIVMALPEPTWFESFMTKVKSILRF